MQFEVSNDRLIAGGRAVPFVPSPNVGGRIEPVLIVVHFTADRPDPKDSVNWFAQAKAKVSAHLVLGRDGSVTQMVDFDRLAMHAGKSHWNGRDGCNGFAIGIEVDNPGALNIRGKDGVAWFGTLFDREEHALVEHTSAKYGHALWMPYTPVQLQALREIITALLHAYPTIVDIRGHDEICVPANRKNDPGPLMDMEALRALVPPRAGVEPVDVLDVQERLAALGFWPGEVDGQMGPRTKSAIRDFQDQNRLPITGELDQRTREVLESDAAKRMPTGTREASPYVASGNEVLVKRSAEVTAGGTLLEASANPAPAMPVDPLAALDHADQAIAHAEKGRAVVERSTGIIDWLIAYLQTPQGLRVGITIAVCSVVWGLAHRRQVRERLAHLTGQKIGG
jgi:N-acetylmuramoyl-L-alanine amidase